MPPEDREPCTRCGSRDVAEQKQTYTGIVEYERLCRACGHFALREDGISLGAAMMEAHRKR